MLSTPYASFVDDICKLTLLQNFRLVQIESMCRRQNKGDWKFQIWLWRVENIVGKEENAGYQHFLLFPHCFQKASLLGQ